jgi:Domain of unknown function (DUF3291)
MEMVSVSITRLRVRSWRFLPLFVYYALRSARQAARAEGNLRACLLSEKKRTFWTATAWTDAAMMKKFMLTGVHRTSMTKLPHWCDEASIVHWNQDSDELPPWKEAAERMRMEGRQSRVNQPSAGHATNTFPDPPPNPKGEFRLK